MKKQILNTLVDKKLNIVVDKTADIDKKWNNRSNQKFNIIADKTVNDNEK